MAWITRLSLIAALLGAGACGDDAANTEAPAGDGDGDGQPLYLMTVQTWDLDGNGTLYALLRDELDLDISSDDLTEEGARSFPGYTGIAVIDGEIVTGDSQMPFGTKFEITADRKWKQIGNRLNFSDYITDTVDGLNFYFQAINGTDMYLFYGADRSSRLHWSTTDWKLKDAYEDTALPARSGWTLGSTGNRTGIRDWKGPVTQTFNLTEDATQLGAPESWIAVYDEDTHEEKDVIAVPCPGLQQQTMDEEGRIYVSTTYNPPTLALYGEEPASCVVRLNADGSLDEEFGENDLTEWTGGFYGVNFRYLKDGKAVANVLHHDRIEGVDWDGDVDPAVAVDIAGEWTDDGYTPEDPTLWDIHVIDLEAGTSKIVTGFEEGHDPASYSIYFPIEDRVFISYQIDPFGDARNVLYELDVDKAEVTFVGDVAGELSSVERVR